MSADMERLPPLLWVLEQVVAGKLSDISDVALAAARDTAMSLDLFHARQILNVEMRRRNAAALAGHDRAVAAIRDGKTPDDVAAADAAGLLGLIQVIQRMLGGNAQAVSIDELLGVQAVVQSLRGAVDDEIARREAT